MDNDRKEDSEHDSNENAKNDIVYDNNDIESDNKSMGNDNLEEGAKEAVKDTQENEQAIEQHEKGETTKKQQEGEAGDEKVGKVKKEENFRDEEREFPDAFYCPVTEEIMKDPVVHPDGKSFERSAVADDTEVIYYPNRALQAIIQNEVLRRNAPLQRTIDTMRKSFQGFVQASTLSLASEFNPLPEQYYCSITLDIMRNPVIDPDGHTFDRRAIVNWIKRNGNSPATRKLVTVNDLYKNTAIMDLLQEEANRDDRSLHPTIRQWKEQTETEEDEDYDLDLEDAEYPSNGVTTAPVIPTSMEELEENRRINRQRQRYLKCRAFVALILVVLGFLHYPYTTMSVVVAMLIVTHAIERAQQRQRQREALEEERLARERS